MLNVVFTLIHLESLSKKQYLNFGFIFILL